MIGQVRGDDLKAVGIGVPSVVEFDTGRVVSSVNIPLADVPLREVLGERLGVPVFVDNDATVAALAEAHDEELRMVARDLVMITVGTGVGGGMVLGGRIYRGATGGAGELGHTLIGAGSGGPMPAPTSSRSPARSSSWPPARPRPAGRPGRDVHPDSALGRLRAEGKPVIGAEAVEAAQDGDEAAVAIVEICGASGSGSGSPTRSTLSTPKRS